MQAVTHPGVGGQTIPAAPSCFLVVAFDVFGHVEVSHKAHVGLVNAHAKGNRGHHYHTVFAQKPVLPLLAHRRVQPGVVGQRLDARIGQQAGHFIDPFARLAVHNAGFTRVVGLNKTKQLPRRVGFFDDGVANVRAVEAADEMLGGV